MSLIKPPRTKWWICNDLQRAARKAAAQGDDRYSDYLWDLRHRAMKQAALTEWGTNR